MSGTPFPISFWCGVPPAEASLERYQEIADAGFTVAQVGGTPERILRALDWCDEVGIAGMVEERRIPRPGRMDEVSWRDDLRDAVADYHDHPAFWGYFITDEPSAEEFPALAEIVAELRRLDGSHPAYINLYPNFAKTEMLGTNRYDEYLSRFISEVRPQLVCYDHYALLDDGSTRPGYFPNLETISAHASGAGLDFWQIILATPVGSYRDPTEAELRWQVWTSLAYGAKGVSYYTYWSPVWTNYHVGIIDEYGERSHRYAQVQRINRGVVALSSMLLNQKSLGVVHGGPTAYDARRPKFVATRPDDPIIIGEFQTADDGAALIVVNMQLEKSTHAHFCLTEEFAGYRTLNRVTGKPGALKAVRIGVRGPEADIWLAPGDGALLLLEEREREA